MPFLIDINKGSVFELRPVGEDSLRAKNMHKKQV